jgi:sensor histidine kinase YesM
VSRLTKFLVFQIIGWGLFSFLNIYVAYLTSELTLAIIFIDCLLALSGIILTSLFRNYIIAHHWLELPTEKLLEKIVVALLTLSLAFSVWYYFLVFFLYYKSFSNISTISILGSFIAIFILFTIWIVIYFSWNYIENNRASLIKRLQLESSMKDLELKTLRSNLQPHFIFNSLNSIRALIDEDPELARQAITKISNILRNSITKQEATDTLENEMNLVDDYLDLEKIRFEERLQIQKDIDPTTLQLHVPTMMLQTLVENAIKHGISFLEDGGIIKIKTSLSGNKFIIEISNSGQLELNTHNENSLGFGLNSSKQRLHYLYGSKATLILEQKMEFVVLTITIYI